MHPSALFWPLSREVYTSPVGVLPSAGALDLKNFYLYRNLIIEIGIFVPIYLSISLLIWRFPRRLVTRAFTLVFLLGVAVTFVTIAVGLSR